MTGESAPSGAPCIYVAMNIAEDSSGEWYVAPSLITGGRNTSSVSSVSSVSPTLHFPPHVQCMLTTCGCIDDVITFFRYYYRALPYDPVRPWKDFDGKWYSAYSTDGCNATTKKVPCAAGGQLEILTSPMLRGPKAQCTEVSAIFRKSVLIYI